jgi:hypothetical protein
MKGNVWAIGLTLVAFLACSAFGSEAVAQVVPEPGYTVTLLNSDLVGPVELDLGPYGNIYIQ